ncbi:MAG: hypothetical protein Q9166_004553 [cf. Caloplaca sp. 2 TL-2023]
MIDLSREVWTWKEPSSFTFTQLLRDSLHGPEPGPECASLHLRGTIYVKEDPTSVQNTIRAEVEIHHHDRQSYTNIVTWIKDTIALHSCVRGSTPTETDITIQATIWISRGLDLSSFNVHTESLAVVFDNDIFFPSHTALSISAPSTAVELSSHKIPSPLKIDSRKTKITAQSGSVTGDFTLRDTLSIHTQSGSININLSLDDSTNTTSPATLDLQARSGSIKVATTTILTPSKIPHRDYQSTLRTNSGAIRANLVHGSTTTLHSDSSSIHASLYPHGAASERSDLTTHVLSGSTDLTIHPSLSNSSTRLRNFHASHTGVSGSIRVLYPAQWEGIVEGSTVSGSIRVNWPGLKITENKSGWGSHSLKGVKGEGEGLVRFSDISGSVELRGMQAVVPVLVKEEGDRAVDGDVESVMEGGEQKVLTPGSEAGDEWVFVQ